MNPWVETEKPNHETETEPI